MSATARPVPEQKGRRLFWDVDGDFDSSIIRAVESVTDPNAIVVTRVGFPGNASIFGMGHDEYAVHVIVTRDGQRHITSGLRSKKEGAGVAVEQARAVLLLFGIQGAEVPVREFGFDLVCEDPMPSPG